MRVVNADIWILTETNDDGRLGADFTPCAKSEGDRSHSAGERWTSISSRYGGKLIPLKEDKERTACVLITPTNRRPLLVYGTVLPWIGSPWHEVPAANGAAFLAALDAQYQEWIDLMETYSDCDFCVAGDFNQDLNSAHYYGSAKGRVALLRSLKEAGLTCVTGGDNDPVISAGHTSRANIDHICLSSDLARNCRLPATVWPMPGDVSPQLSDHFGVCIEIE